MANVSTGGANPDSISSLARQGVSAGVKLIETLVGLGLRTSKHGDLDFPPAKPCVGDLSGFAPKPRRAER